MKNSVNSSMNNRWATLCHNLITKRWLSTISDSTSSSTLSQQKLKAYWDRHLGKQTLRRKRTWSSTTYGSSSFISRTRTSSIHRSYKTKMRWRTLSRISWSLISASFQNLDHHPLGNRDFQSTRTKLSSFIWTISSKFHNRSRNVKCFHPLQLIIRLSRELLLQLSLPLLIPLRLQFRT